MSLRGENIYKRKDGRWEGRYKKGRKQDGKIHYGYIYGKTYKDVKFRLYDYKLQFESVIKISGEGSFSYEYWGLEWVTQLEYLVKKSTYSNYLYKLKKYIFPIIGNIPINQITRRQIQEMIKKWQQAKLSTSTIHVLYQIVKKTLKDATIQQYITQSPCQGITLPKKSIPKGQSLTKQEQKKIENHAKKLPLHKGLVVLLALDTGLRIGEIAALRWEDIDLVTHTIHVRNTYQRISIPLGHQRTQMLLDSSKTNRSDRMIPISINLYKYLKKWKRKSTSQYVCSNKKSPSEPRLLTYYFHKIRAACELGKIHFHQLRHTFATRCIESSGDIVSISRLLGHRSPNTTLEIYADSMLESRRQVIKNMSI